MSESDDKQAAIACFEELLSLDDLFAEPAKQPPPENPGWKDITQAGLAHMVAQDSDCVRTTSTVELAQVGGVGYVGQFREVGSNEVRSIPLGQTNATKALQLAHRKFRPRLHALPEE